MTKREKIRNKTKACKNSANKEDDPQTLKTTFKDEFNTKY